MRDLKSHTLLLVGTVEDRIVFKKYFKEVIVFGTNKEALTYYYEKKPSFIFLLFNTVNMDAYYIAKEIREYDLETILVIIFESKMTCEWIKFLPLHFSGYLEKPLNAELISKILKNITYHLKIISKDIFILNGKYSFYREEEILYNAKNNEVRLTKNEKKLIKILTQRKHQYYSSEFLEHSIWNIDSASIDCNSRLKFLLYGIRKKLPKNTIINSYTLGYKIISLV